MTLIDAQSSTHGPTGSKTPLDMISNFGNGRLVRTQAEPTQNGCVERVASSFMGSGVIGSSAAPEVFPKQRPDRGTVAALGVTPGGGLVAHGCRWRTTIKQPERAQWSQV